MGEQYSLAEIDAMVMRMRTTPVDELSEADQHAMLEVATHVLTISERIEPMSEIITLPTGGSLPGIPGGEYAPGVYEVDWEARTLTPVVQAAPTPEPVAASVPEAQPATPEPVQPEQ